MFDVGPGDRGMPDTALIGKLAKIDAAGGLGNERTKFPRLSIRG